MIDSNVIDHDTLSREVMYTLVMILNDMDPASANRTRELKKSKSQNQITEHELGAIGTPLFSAESVTLYAPKIVQGLV